MKISELLCDESKWCKEHNAVDAQGNSVYHGSEEAVKWCLLGAFLKCGLIPELGQIINVDITEFNDDPSTTFQDVLEVIRKYEARYEG